MHALKEVVGEEIAQRVRHICKVMLSRKDLMPYVLMTEPPHDGHHSLNMAGKLFPWNRSTINSNDLEFLSHRVICLAS